MARSCGSMLGLACLLVLAGCGFHPTFDGYRRCAEGCPPGCGCVAGEICLPDDPALPPGCCLLPVCEEEAPCLVPEGCPLGCLCAGDTCLPPAGRSYEDYCLGLTDVPDLSCQRPITTARTEAELRGMIADAATAGEPMRITFQPYDETRELEVNQELPPIPDNVWLDGARSQGQERFTLRAAAGAGFPGLRVAGTGVILSDLTLVGFGGPAVVVQGEARDVHLYRMRLGELGAGNGGGLRIEPGARQVVLGRGRELYCGTDLRWEYRREPMALEEWDLNVIVENDGPGVEAVGVRDLVVEATWVGFDKIGDPGHGSRELGNQGPGIHLQGVTDAFLGPRYVTEPERRVQDDFRPGCVAVGRSSQGGVWIEGGGEIDMRCTLIGDTPIMVPYDENLGFGLRVEGNTGPVRYGPRAEDLGFEAASLNLIHTETAPALEIRDAQALVAVRGAQLQWLDEGSGPLYAVTLEGGGTEVEMVHLTILGSFTMGLIRVEDGVGLRLENSLLWSHPYPSALPALDSNTAADRLALHRNALLGLGSLCEGRCPQPDESNWFMSAAQGEACAFTPSIPTTPSCPLVDCGLDLGLDVNGPLDGRYTGCGPDVGAHECTTEDCRLAACPPQHCPE